MSVIKDLETVKWFVNKVIDNVLEELAMKQKPISCPAYLFFEEDEQGQKKPDGIMGINPVYKTKGAACADVSLPYDVTLLPHETYCLDLWLGFEIPEGYKVVMYPRSSLLVKKGLMSPVSIIDQDYSGQRVHWPVHNLTSHNVKIEKGDRVAQIECVPCLDCEDWGHDDKERATVNGGFGSTGDK